MYYRRKLLLSLVSSFGGSLQKSTIQKLLFLVSKLQAQPEYTFVPTNKGCYSFQAEADLKTLGTYGNIIELEGNLKLSDSTNYNALLKQTDKLLLMQVKKQFLELVSTTELDKYIYSRYPYFAIHFPEAKNFLSQEEYLKVQASKPKSNKQALFTIGYEGISLETYVNKLIQNDVKVLCDVRSNAFSQKFGFSKKQLEQACKDTGIRYEHFPELGINSKERKKLETQVDYNELFRAYKKNIIPNTRNYQEQLVNLLAENDRLAITCFEANIHQCHRLHLSEALAGAPEWHYEVNHI